MQLINLDEYRQKEVVEALRALLEAAEAGHIQGLAYVIKGPRGEHRAGIVGIYRRQPEKALQATFALERHLCRTGPFAQSRY